MTAAPRDSVGTLPVADAPADAPEAKAPGGFGVRHLEILLMFCGMTIAYMLRVNMSVAIVAMSDSSTSNPDIEDFGWDSSTQSYILSSFFWGYVITQIPAGQIAHLWSAAKLWSLCMFVCGVVNILIPVAARVGDWGAVCACRIVMGLSQGCVLPSVHTLLGKWVPPNERARLGTYAYAGAQFGTVIGLPVSGLLAASSAGWPSIFYLVGAITIVWSVVFFIWGSDSPARHRSIKPAEKDYIETSLGQVDVQTQHSTPWIKIITSVPVWSLIIVHCGQNWGYWTLLTEMPSYMNHILGFDISKNGFISALPYLAMWLLSFPFSWFSDYVIRRGWVSRAVSRKVSNSIGHWGPAVALMGLGYATAEHTVIAVVILVFAVGLNAGSLCGYQINHIDLSPNFAGTLMAITNCIANIMSIVAPLICGLIVTDLTDLTQWRTVFFISAGIYILCNLVFVLFGKAEVQPWNDTEVKPDSENGRNQSSKKTDGKSENK
ncbi:putative inorganic phosphate cotransporter isoform X1 [Neodiprion pinetum]|uniref:Putative inorganic phosphate cotransporter n=1 Tax=Neodiprion lecontei TaxID=441921 RepID=A0A6J0CBW0_NEOLC|nr:putative inorganic phosphate cotransporter isoform X1 [Neodiprion lecontei]XP_046482126.1 putative inorganic phosphate cotransporter isoform X1 [Neodiprion pinetum]